MVPIKLTASMCKGSGREHGDQLRASAVFLCGEWLYMLRPCNQWDTGQRHGQVRTAASNTAHNDDECTRAWVNVALLGKA